ncbi:MAG: hypothetical protein ACW990_17560 [Promethearchaeota archaeon]|jgi:hypothetical protein
MKCPHCDTQNNFEIWAYDRLGNRNSDIWEVMLKCNICNSSSSHRFKGFKYQKHLLKHLRKIIRPRKGQAFIQEVWAHDWTDSGYDFSKKKKVIPQDY